MYYEWSFGFSFAIERFVLYSYRSWAFQVLPQLALLEFVTLMIVMCVLQYSKTNFGAHTT